MGCFPILEIREIRGLIPILIQQEHYQEKQVRNAIREALK